MGDSAFYQISYTGVIGKIRALYTDTSMQYTKIKIQESREELWVSPPQQTRTA